MFEYCIGQQGVRLFQCLPKIKGFMRHLNYNHLLYFWTVAREGSVARAAEVLHLTPQTISGQLKLLEESIGEPLFQRVGRGLAITEMGRVVEQYADEIFSLGAELSQRVRSKDPGSPATFNVGIVNSIPKLIAYQILEPALKLEEPVKLICQEDDLHSLLAELAVHKLDLVLSDRGIPAGLNVRAYNHQLGASRLSFYGRPDLIEKYPGTFPEMLEQAPVLMPLHTNALRRTLDDWFDRIGVRPNIVAELDDSGLLKAFGEAGIGFFPAPTAIANEIRTNYRVQDIGEVKDFHEQFFVISPERKLKHPAVVAIIDAAKQNLNVGD